MSVLVDGRVTRTPAFDDNVADETLYLVPLVPTDETSPGKFKCIRHIVPANSQKRDIAAHERHVIIRTEQVNLIRISHLGQWKSVAGRGVLHGCEFKKVNLHREHTGNAVKIDNELQFMCSLFKCVILNKFGLGNEHV